MRHEQISIIEAIRLDEARLARLDEERQVVNDRLRHLHAQLAALEVAATPTVESSSLSPDEKIALFRSIFRGREDVFPKLWISQKGDRKGYMPACVNDGSYATGVLDVAMMQSLVRKEEVADLVADYGQVIVDECHHLPAFSFERVLAEVNVGKGLL